MKGRKPRVSLIRQRDSADCGPACLVSIAGAYGYYIAVSRVRQMAGTNQNGTSVAGIVETAIALGFDAKGVKATLDAMTAANLPAIVHCVMKRETSLSDTHTRQTVHTSHYMVAVEINNRFVKLMDPAEGRVKRLTKKQFLAIWTGVTILLHPAEKFITNEKTGFWKRIKTIAFPVRRLLILCMLCSITTSILGLSLSLFVKEIFDIVVPTKNMMMAHVASATVILLLVLQYTLTNIKNRLILITTQRLNSSLIMGYYGHVMRLPVSFFKSMRVGDIVNRLNDTGKITGAINDFAINIAVDVLTIGFSLCLMFIYNWKIACVITLVIPFYALLYRLTNKINRNYQRGVIEAGANLEAHLIESISNAVSIKHLGLQDQQISYTKQRLFTLLDRSFGYGTRQLRLQSTGDGVTKLFTVLLLWIGTYYIMYSELSVGELISFYTLLGYFSVPVLYLLGAARNFGEAKVAAERLFETLELEQCRYGAKKMPEGQSACIEFKEVTFAYGTSDPLLKQVSLKFKPGSITGITGKSGTGKSTLLSLLLRDYPLKRGEILINGINIADLDKKSIDELISLAPQEPVLFTGTVSENIMIGQDYNEERLLDITERLAIDEIGISTSKGLDVYISEGGRNLSGGQTQRISLARALYRNAPVLLLDEATAAIDKHSEDKIMQTIDWYKNKGNTVIIVAHSESTLKICDNIAVLEDGYIR